MSGALRQAQLAELVAGSPALIVVDVQRDFADPERLVDYGMDDAALAALAAAVERIAWLVERARELGVPVAWVELASDPGSPWRASNWLRGGDSAAPMATDEPCIAGSAGAQWYRTGPAPGELRVQKSRYSGFVGTDLESRLREAGHDWLTVVGVTTECCVAATAQDAMQRDWPVVVAGDATAAYAAETHAAALAALGLNVGLVLPAAEVAEVWERSTA